MTDAKVNFKCIICSFSWKNLRAYIDYNCDYGNNILGSQDMCERAIDIALYAMIKEMFYEAYQ